MNVYQEALNYCIRNGFVNYKICHSDNWGFAVEWYNKGKYWIDAQSSKPHIYRASGNSKEELKEMLKVLEISEEQVRFLITK